MKRINALLALSIGVIASSSGMIQAQAATYNYFVDFGTKEVADFTAYNQTFFDSTSSLGNQIKFQLVMSYSVDSCPTAFPLNFTLTVLYRVNDTGPFDNVQSLLPDGTCSTTPVSYLIERTFSVSNTVLDALIDDDANFIAFVINFGVTNTADTNGRTITYSGYNITFTYQYLFNTTYLFNYFLSDQKFDGLFYSGWSFTGTRSTKLNYVYTTAGNDEYYILNTGGDVSTNRKKYAIDYNGEFFRGESVGSQFGITRSGTAFRTLSGTTGRTDFGYSFKYYYLNTANNPQPLVNVPQISFTTQSCSGGFLDINVGCYVNNAMAWLTNDAPIISDLTTIVNTGIQFAGQTFGIIGNFTTSNMFGYLILGGFGFIAVKWLFKDDK
jgi:hypothetical protein